MDTFSKAKSLEAKVLHPTHLVVIGAAAVIVGGALLILKLLRKRTARMHPFLEAAKRGDHASLNKYINGVGFDVDTLKDEDDNTGLNIACKGTCLECIEVLLSAGANVRTSNKYGLTPLHTVVYFKGPIDAITKLVEQGANINATDNNGWTPLCMAASAGDNERLRLMIQLGGSVNQATLANQTPLLIASCNGHTEVVRTLLDARADPTIRTATVHESPLIYAVANGHFDIVNMLLDADISLLKLGTVSGIMPIHVAAQKKNKEMINLLIQRGADINTPKSDGATVLNIAAEFDDRDLVLFLLEKGARMDTKTKYGSTPLHIACTKRNYSVVEVLLNAGHPVNVQDNDGLTPLHSICSISSAEDDITIILNIAEQLLARGAEINATDRVGGTPLHHCVCRKSKEALIEYLLSKGADPTLEDITGWTPLHLLIQMYPNDKYENIIRCHIQNTSPSFFESFDPKKPRAPKKYIDPSAPMLSDAERMAVLGGDTSPAAIAKRIKDGVYKNIIVLTGAGISTNSGIPDFRSERGLYTNQELRNSLNVGNAFSLGDFMQNPASFYRIVYTLFLPVVQGHYKPTAFHFFISLLHKKGLLRRNYTQNVDMLEIRAGIPKEKVVESHGSFASATCKDCNKPYADMKHFWNQVEIGCIPRCMECNGERVKPDIVFFGEGLPARFTDLQDEDFKQCDLLIVAGTSLSVYPFAGLVNKVPPTTPRLLLNNQDVGPFKSIPHFVKMNGELVRKEGTQPSWRDVCMLGDIDEMIWEFAKMLEWDKELQQLIEMHE